MTLAQFQTTYPHLNYINSPHIVNMTVNQTIPIADAIQVTIKYNGRQGVSSSEETGYFSQSSNGFINNYMTIGNSLFKRPQ